MIRALVILVLPACVLSFPRAPDGTEGAPPAVFFTDLESGPNTVGIDGLGAIVTIYGRRFGNEPGRVTVGGGEVARYVAWADDRISVLLGPATVTGPVVVHTATGASNDDITFTVRPGNTYCVSLEGSNENFGRFADSTMVRGCWETLQHAVGSIAPGDIVYALDGVAQIEAETIYEAALSVERTGAPGSPFAIVAFPGARVTIATDSLEGILVPRIDPPGGAAHWVFAGLEIRAPAHAIDSSASNWRFVGNDISCTASGGFDLGCIELGGDDVTLLGNDVHDVGVGAPEIPNGYSALRANGARMTLGFNRFHDLETHIAVRLGGAGPADGSRAFSNRFENTRCAALSVERIEGSDATIEAFNNLFVRVGNGPDPTARCWGAAAFSVGCEGAPTSVVRAYNNTFVECGGLRGDTAGAIATCAAGASLVFDNNVVVQPPALRYAVGDGRVSGTRNVWFGAGAGPSTTTESFETDPALDPTTLRLGQASGALDTATGVVPVRDFDGIPRPRGAGTDPGAFEAF